MTKLHSFLLSISAAALAPAAATAQSYPERPVRVVVPFPAGGAADIVARQVTQGLAAALGSQFVVDNRAGAGGAIGAETVARSAPDGYTLLFASSSALSINPHIAAKLSYDALRDFSPIALIGFAPNVLVVHPSVPAKSVKDLIAVARSKPNALNFASNGTGTLSHLTGELFMQRAGVKMVHIPYKGLAPALTDLISGEVQVMFSSAVAALPQAKAGRLRAIAMTGSKRSAAIPDIPTVAESGLPGYETGSWYGVVVPAGTPKVAIDRLSKEIQAIVKAKDVTSKLNEEAVIPIGNPPEEFAKHIRAELARWAKVIKAAKIELE